MNAASTQAAAPLPQALWRRIDSSGDHWLWLGAKDRDGYASMTVGPAETERVHRAVWTLLRGPLDGKLLQGLCRHRHCVNPDHYRPVDRADLNRHRLSGRRERPRGRNRNPRAAEQEALHQRILRRAENGEWAE